MLVLSGICLAGLPASGRGEETRVYAHRPREEVTLGRRGMDFGTLYLGQWFVYGLTQRKNIRENGSFRNWRTYPFKPHLDRDGIDYNVVSHSFSGATYFLYYRARGYSRKEAVLSAVMSSAAFEFTIETVTERPSYQDLYQTPILGSVLGFALEEASFYFHSRGSGWGRVLGTLFNPFTLFPFARYGFEVVPIAEPGRVGALIGVEF